MRRRPSIEPGIVLGGRYRVLRELGAGGMGAVYEGVQEDLGRRVAIKLVRVEEGDTGALRRFQREARATARLHHPNIVQVTDFGVDGGQPYLVMELLLGETLRARLRRERPLSPDRAVDLIAPVLSALAYAHEQGVVHRDVKPDNVLLVSVGTEPVPKLVDFGIARDEVHDSSRLTDTEGTLGTAAYMAPEQVRTSRLATAAVDQYAVGVMLFEALTGGLPHEGTAIAAAATKLIEAAPPIATRRPELPEALCRVVDRALSMDPEARFASAAAMRSALLESVGRFDSGAGVAPPGSPERVRAALAATAERTIAPPETDGSEPTTTPRGPATPRRARAWARAAVALAGIAALGSALVGLRGLLEDEAAGASRPPVATSQDDLTSPAVADAAARPADPIDAAPAVGVEAPPDAAVAPSPLSRRRSRPPPEPRAADPVPATHARLGRVSASGYSEWAARAHLDTIARGVDRCVAAAGAAAGGEVRYRVPVDAQGRAGRAERTAGPSVAGLDECIGTALRHAGWSVPVGAASVEVTYHLEP